MNSKDTEDLLVRRLAGEDVARGEPQISYEPIQPTGHPDGDGGRTRLAEERAALAAARSHDGTRVTVSIGGRTRSR